LLAVAVFLVVLTVLSIAGLAVYMGGETNNTDMQWILTQLNLHKIIFLLHGEKVSLSIHLTYITRPLWRTFI
jgi:hypothetical protein